MSCWNRWIVDRRLAFATFAAVSWVTLASPPTTAQSQWRDVTPGPPQPSARGFSAMAYDSARRRVVLFGGRDSTGTDFDDTWEWDGSGWTLASESGPLARNAHAMAYDSARGRTVLFGGFNYGSLTYLGDTWEWDGNNWVDRTTSGPSLRGAHAMAYDSARQRVILFGGADDNGSLGDTWEWDGNGWSLMSESGPAARRFHAMVYDSARQRVVLFGGSYGFGNLLGDTWEWDGSVWVDRTTTGPSPRHEHAMAFDNTRQRIVLFGGHEGNNISDETWEWDGSSWTLAATSGPAPRFAHAMTYDSARERVVLFGGLNNQIFDFDNETWVYAQCDENESFRQAVCKCPDRLKLVAKGAATANQQVVVEGDNGLGSHTVTANARDKWKAVFSSIVVCGTTYQMTATFECGQRLENTATCQ